MREIYRIGPFVLDVEAGVLMRSGTPVALGKRAVSVLAVLVEAAPAYVSKASILDAAWPGLVVQESNLAVQVFAIRRVLAQADGGQAWLETLARRGYRFVGPVDRETAAAGDFAQRSNLAEPLTSFVGRERELAEVATLLAKARLLTLTGAGGVGKTRLAMRAASAVAARYADGVWLLELASLTDPGVVAQAVATVLGLQEAPGTSFTRTLVGHLAGRHCLLLLDNAEHVLPACTELASTLLQRCPGITLLVTSRERLSVPGEVTYRVPSLSMPDEHPAATAASVAVFDSVRLFAERARLHHPQFALTDQNAAVLSSICRHLDGIPLAIELAAARTRSMSAEELERRLDQRFALLTGGPRTLPRRQQTLRAAIDWSYNLLAEAEKALLCRLSVFSGGATLEAAEQVCAGEGIGAHEMLDHLAALVDKSLVVVEERNQTTRHRLLETVHRYAAERLEGNGDAVSWRSRHFEHFSGVAIRGEPQLTGKDQRAWLERLEAEHDNMRAALAQAGTEVASGVEALRLASALSRFWLVRGCFTEGRRWLSQLLEVAGEADLDGRAKALNWAGVLAWKQGDYAAARDFYERCLLLRRRQGDQRGIGMVLSNLGLLAYERGDYDAALALHEESLAIDRGLGNQWGIAVSLVHLGALDAAHGKLALAAERYQESLAIFRALDDRGHVANALRRLGTLSGQQGDAVTSRRLFAESLEICRELGDRTGTAWALSGLGSAARQQGDLVEAQAREEEALAILRQVGDLKGVANALHDLGRIAAAQADFSVACRLYRESLAIFRELGERPGIAALMESLADVACASGAPLPAARLWGALERLREEIDEPLAVSERAAHEQRIASARAALGAAGGFEHAWEEGRRMPLDQVLEESTGAAAPCRTGAAND